MEEDMKGVTLFADGRWLIQKTRNKRTITKRGVGGEAAARRALAEIARDLNELVENQRAADRLGVKLSSDGSPVQRLTFKQLFDEKYTPWAKAELGATTFRSRESVHWHLLMFFGNTPLDAITAEIVDAFKAKRLKEGVIYKSDKTAASRKPRPLSKAGLAEQLKVLRAILNWAKKRGHLHHVPTVEMPKEKRGAPGAAKPVRYFTVEERARLFRRVKSQELADVIRFGLLTGARPAEIFHMRCRSVDLQRRTLTIEEQPCTHPDCPDGKWIPKVGTWRVVEIAPDLLPVLRRVMKGKRPEDLLFPNDHGKPFTRLQGGGGSFSRALHNAGLRRQGLSFYSLRHTFASDLASAGVPLNKIAALLGHTDLRSTQCYAHLTPTALDGVVANVRLPDAWCIGGAQSNTKAHGLTLVREKEATAPI
jgi:integrase